MLNAFTVDVEDYFQVSAFERQIPRTEWPNYECRVVENTTRILDLLDRHQVKGTFFILGWVAERFPDLVRQIDAGGHEVGSHSYWHRLVYELSEAEFRDDLRKSRDTLSEIINKPITSYRAPSFSIVERSKWALDILAEEGFDSDSSIFPVSHDRYGYQNVEPHIHTIETAAGPITEFPLCYRQMMGYRLPISGGGYFRLYPFFFSHRCFHHLNRKSKRPFVFYIHPWEVDPLQPRMKVGSRLSRFRHYVNLKRTERKLDSLLKSFQFGRMDEVIAQQKADAN